MPELYIAMVGLPARGKSTIARKIQAAFSKENIRCEIFNNGNVRRDYFKNTTKASFYDSSNKEAAQIREKIAMSNLKAAKKFDEGVAIIDATNVSSKRRKKICKVLDNAPLVFIECLNNDMDLLSASIEQKTKTDEFCVMSPEKAFKSFEKRIEYYKQIYTPVSEEPNYIILDSLNNEIIKEKTNQEMPHYVLLRDTLVSDWIDNLFLLRHGYSKFNHEKRIGGNPELSDNGFEQAEALAKHFSSIKIPVIFTGKTKRTKQTASPIKKMQNDCQIIELEEFNEIHAGICEEMTYEEIRKQMPDVYNARALNKYHYIYPRGEGYVTLYTRVFRGLKKALFLSGNTSTFMIVGHQAVNRIILSYFLYRRKKDVPYIYVPQHKFFHITSRPDKRHTALHRFN
ncbi:MAG: bifunctional nucleoside/nucleotide kinase/histidine phosphatase family protein [Candidatus Nanoarchaeia archaeon]